MVTLSSFLNESYLHELKVFAEYDGLDKVAKADIHLPAEKVSDWQVSLRYLESGNQRYRENKTINHRLGSKEERDSIKDSQQPFAVIIACSDSRTIPEFFFDQKPGDIFVIRSAGNTIDVTALGSIEFAAEYLMVPLVMVVGHSNCGVVNAALKGGVYGGNLQKVIDIIRPQTINCADLLQATQANIHHHASIIRKNEVIKRMGVKVIGGYYDIETGGVTILDDDATSRLGYSSDS
ncbi:MAG: carbonic anhydrase [Lachnospiraceae bacterium]|jgi:carbonic anhydrase|nr:carbonic anhydrase [Lachnospiraceae bacterium]